MAGVPILGLPLIPQLAVLDNVDNKDLFSLSLISKRSKHLVQLANRSIEGVTVEFKKDEELCIFADYELLMRVLGTEGQATFQGVDKMAMCSGETEWKAVCYEAGRYQEMEKRVIRHLFAVFKELGNVFVTLEDVERIHSHVLWNHTKNLGSLNVSIQNRKLTAEEVTFLFEELTVCDTFSISAPTEGFEYPNGFTHNDVEFELPQCPIDTIMVSRSEAIEIRCPLFPVAGVNRLLKAWIARESMENLKSFVIKTDDIMTFEQMDETFQGIPVQMSPAVFSIISRVDGRRALAEFHGNKFSFQVAF